jgi:hypothetical protein
LNPYVENFLGTLSEIPYRKYPHLCKWGIVGMMTVSAVKALLYMGVKIKFVLVISKFPD